MKKILYFFVLVFTFTVGFNFESSASLRNIRYLPTERDTALLARFIEAETGGRDWLTMIAVATDAVSKVGKSGHADTLAGVIFEYGIYDSVARGEIQRIKPSELSLRAAYDTLSGMRTE